MNRNKSFTGLSPHLLARVYPMKRSGDGTVWVTDQDRPYFEAPLTSATLELVAGWASPFENAGVESQYSALAAMAQSGSFLNITNAFGAKMSDEARKDSALLKRAEDAAKTLVGRSGVTKMNSTQVWSGQQPTKIQISAFLRAFRDPQREVEGPLQMLQSWMMPRRLENDGVITALIKSEGDVLSLMPSETPEVVLFSYKNRIFGPCVIESVSDDLGAPIDKDGNRISALVNVTICSLTALDQRDWARTYASNRVYQENM